MKASGKKLWQKNQDVLNAQIERFTIGKDRELDLMLARWDVIGSLAHCTMLRKVNLLDESTFRILKKGLKEILRQIDSGNFKIEEGVEDVHSQVELMLTQKWPEAGARLHTGRSRNDQILTDLRLFTRAQIQTIVEETKALFDVLQNLSEKYKEVMMPGYTHFQVAMPSSFGLWLGAFAESLADDLWQLLGAYRIVNKNPLGSAAGYGSTFPLDRTLTTRLLGFETLNYNSVYAQMGRGKTERVVSEAIGGLAETISKLSMDLVLFQSQNFDFLHFPENITTGSSIMPHKKNPDVFELLRARCNLLRSLPEQIKMLTTNLPSGYHRDYQLLKEAFLPALREITECLRILTLVLPEMQVNKNLLSDPRYRYIFTVEKINRLVQQGVPFREAYHQIAGEVEDGSFQPPGEGLEYTHEGSIGRLCSEEIKQLMESVIKEFDFSAWQTAIQKLIES